MPAHGWDKGHSKRVRRMVLMGFRFYRRVHLCPGLSVNLSRSGPSLTLGVRGAHVTLGRDRITKTVGLPGTGIFYTSRQGMHTGYHSAKHDAPVTPEMKSVCITNSRCASRAGSNSASRFHVMARLLGTDKTRGRRRSTGSVEMRMRPANRMIRARVERPSSKP